MKQTIKSDGIFLPSELENAQPLQVALTCDDSNVDKAISFLLGEIKLGGRKKNKERHIKCVLINLIRIYKYYPDSYISYSRNNSYEEYRVRIKGKLNTENPFSVTAYISKVVDELFELGYVENYSGFYDRESCTGRNSRMKPTMKMVELFLKYGLLATNIYYSDKLPLVITKDKNKNVLQKTLPNYMRNIEKELTAYNSLLNRTEVSLLPKHNTSFPPDKKLVRRMFNNGGYKLGGRFYGGWWQNIESHLRKCILINGNPTVELDYTGNHIYFLYAKTGSKPSIGFDPFKLENVKYDRKLIKTAVYSAINAPSIESGWKGTQQKIRDKKKSLHNKGKDNTYCDLWLNQIRRERDYIKLIQIFIDRNPLIEQFLHTGLALELQNKDSQIASYIINHFTTNNIPVLCIHDSFIVEECYRAELYNTMQEAYKACKFDKALPPIH